MNFKTFTIPVTAETILSSFISTDEIRGIRRIDFLIQPSANIKLKSKAVVGATFGGDGAKITISNPLVADTKIFTMICTGTSFDDYLDVQINMTIEVNVLSVDVVVYFD